MALSKQKRIIIILAIDIAFFLLEIIVGYAVHSLALVADSFHMLNDVISLFVGLWAVRVKDRRKSSKTFTYGWQRAETLGALVNGVFLVALCVTIFLEAIQRFFEPKEVSKPVLVLIVGCCGLGSNILGLILFHDHGHSHGGHGPAQGELGQAEEGHAHSHEQGDDHTLQTGETAYAPEPSERDGLLGGQERTDTAEIKNAPRASTGSLTRQVKQHRLSQVYPGMEGPHLNPKALQSSILQEADRLKAGRLQDAESGESSDDEIAVDEEDVTSRAHVRSRSKDTLPATASPNGYGTVGGTTKKRESISNKENRNARPKEASSGHSHGDLNMRGIFLHVLGDALGNIGVILSALIIWKTDVPWRFYCDPAVSLVITVIILFTAWPLCKAASRILLQAVPLGINIDEIQANIQDLPGIVSCHHLHVWQLSDTKIVASLHVQVGKDVAGYMELAQEIQRRLREKYGIYSSTIQPEFCLDPQHVHSPQDGDGGATLDSDAATTIAANTSSGVRSKAGSVSEPDRCLLDCGTDLGDGRTCCPPSQDGDEGT